MVAAREVVSLLWRLMELKAFGRERIERKASKYLWKLHRRGGLKFTLDGITFCEISLLPHRMNGWMTEKFHELRLINSRSILICWEFRFLSWREKGAMWDESLIRRITRRGFNVITFETATSVQQQVRENCITIQIQPPHSHSAMFH